MKLYAKPYDADKKGFYFESFAEYEPGVVESDAEEFEIMFIDSDFNSAIFYSMKVSQCNIEESFELADVLEAMNEEQLTAVEFLVDCGHDINDALDKYEDVCVSSEPLNDYAYDLMTECYSVPENILHYLDYRAFARDLKLEGSVVELNDYLITNANEFKR